MSESDFAFQDIPLPERAGKPRKTCQTMMIDWGLPLNLQLDLLAGQGLYVDEAKIAAAIPRVMPKDYLIKKIEAYKAADIFVFPGGLFAELALAQGNYGKFLDEAVRIGFSGIEVSDNLIRLPAKEKRRAIAQATREYGLAVMGEVGRKEGGMTGDEILADVENCLEAEAKMVLLEAHELFHGEIRADVIDGLLRRVPLEKVMFELPVVVLPDVTKEYKTKVLFWMVRRFGMEVNLANVEWDEVYFTEISRRGASGDLAHQDGAYGRAGMVEGG